MQHPILRATFFSFFAGSFLCGPLLAGQMHGHRHSAGYQLHAAPAHQPVQMYQGANERTRAPDAKRQAATQINPAANALIVPLPVRLPPRQILGIDSETLQLSYRPYPAHAQHRPAEMLSGNPVDPYTMVSQLPSGSIVMQSPAQYYGHHYNRCHHRSVTTQRPYSPPTFQIIGEPSAKHMGNPVKLTYGTPTQKRLNPAPRVIWIKAEKGGKNIEVIK